MPKIKVLQLGSPSGLYGAERWILALIKNLNPEKIESWVGAIKDEPGLQVLLCQEAKKFGFRTHILESYGKLNFSTVGILRKHIQQNDIDILHTHGYKTDLIGLCAVKGTKCKIVSTPHGWTKHPDFKLRCYEILDRLIFPFFDAVVPLSDGIYQPLQSIPGLKKRLHLISNGVDTQEIESAKKISNEISAWKEEGAFIIGYIGRLTPGKGLDVLLNAFASHAEPHWRIAIVGEGEQEAELKTLAERLNINNSVKFFGFRHDRISFLKGFDVFVLPSESEGIPRCLMEAMAAGVPVVASDIPGCCYLVDDKKTGLLFPVNNERALAEAIKKMTFNDSLREALSRRAQELIFSDFSALNMAQGYETLFAGMIET